MSLIPAKTILAALKDRLAALMLDESGNTEALFERVEIYANKRLGEALSDLIITKQRICLIVPTGIERDRVSSGSTTVLRRRWLEVDLLIADRAFYKSAQRAVEGGDKNLGVIELVERLETSLDGFELTAWGAAELLDGTPFELSAQDAPGREAWVQGLLIPAGDIRSETF